MKCGLKTIESVEIKEEDINYNQPSYYIYCDKEFIYFNDFISANITTKDELRKLLNGETLRVPTFRNKERGKKNRGNEIK